MAKKNMNKIKEEQPTNAAGKEFSFIFNNKWLAQKKESGRDKRIRTEPHTKKKQKFRASKTSREREKKKAGDVLLIKKKAVGRLGIKISHRGTYFFFLLSFCLFQKKSHGFYQQKTKYIQRRVFFLCPCF
jgi:hypothetical protein